MPTTVPTLLVLLLVAGAFLAGIHGEGAGAQSS